MKKRLTYCRQPRGLRRYINARAAHHAVIACRSSVRIGTRLGAVRVVEVNAPLLAVIGAIA